MSTDVLVAAPFRRPTFRTAMSSAYPVGEPWDAAPLATAAAIESAGLSVAYLALQNIFDAWHAAKDDAALRQLLERNVARAVVFASDNFIASRSTAAIYGMQTTARLVRAVSPGAVIGVTGRLATTAGIRILNEVPEADFLVHGEAEAVIGSILVDILRHGLIHADHPSLITRSARVSAGTRADPTLSHGKLQIGAAKVAALDDAPAPAWHLLQESIRAWDAQHENHPVPLPFSLRTSAGCKFRCRFCAGVPYWLDYRTKSAKRVAEEIDSLFDAVGSRAHLSFIEDEIFTRNPEHVAGVSAVFAERGIKVDGVYTHSTLMTPQVAGDLARMTRKVFFGLDNADDTALRDMRKGQRLDTVLAAVQTARSAGLATHLEWIIGSPADTLHTLVGSLNAICNLLATGSVDTIDTYIYCPHPGTEYAEYADKYGLHIVDGFEFMQESGGYPSYQTDSLSSQQIFTAYLMSQLAIAETLQARAKRGPGHVIGHANHDEMIRLLEKFGAARP